MRQTIATLMMIFTLMTSASQYGIAQIGISSTSTLEGANLGEISLQMSDAGPYKIEVSSADGDIVCTLSDVSFVDLNKQYSSRSYISFTAFDDLL